MDVAKACPAVLRGSGDAREILVFTHPLAGVQLVKGTVEPGEASEAAARRELFEEAGLDGLPLLGQLQSSRRIAPDQNWHFFLFSGEGLPERWTHHCADDGGHFFSFFWHRLADDPGEDWHEIFRRVLAHIRDQAPPEGRT